MAVQIVLMVGLRIVEPLQRHDLGDDGAPEHARCLELGDVAVGHALLVGVGIEDGRTVLRAGIRPLPVQFRRVMRDGKEHLQELPVADARRVVENMHRLGMAGPAAAHLAIRGRIRIAAGVARHHPGDALDMLEHPLHSPEASAGQHSRLHAAHAGERDVDDRVGQRRGGRRVRTPCQCNAQDGCDDCSNKTVHDASPLPRFGRPAGCGCPGDVRTHVRSIRRCAASSYP